MALNERTERTVVGTVGARSQSPLFRRQDGRRVRAGNPAPRVPLQHQAVYRLLGELAESAELTGDCSDQVDGVHPHRLRHTFVTTLLDMGVPLQAVPDAARHASPDTTRMYDRARGLARASHPPIALRLTAPEPPPSPPAPPPDCVPLPVSHIAIHLEVTLHA